MAKFKVTAAAGIDVPEVPEVPAAPAVPGFHANQGDIVELTSEQAAAFQEIEEVTE
jgi:hypothetical protein